MRQPGKPLKFSRALGGWALILSSVVGALVGALVAPSTLLIARALSGHTWRSPRYWVYGPSGNWRGIRRLDFTPAEGDRQEGDAPRGGVARHRSGEAGGVNGREAQLD
jgi:hypothetical protein